MSFKVAIFVDGDNLRACFADKIMSVAKAQGDVLTARVYGNQNTLSNWSDSTAFQFIYSGENKNGADVHLAIDATEMTLTHDLDAVVLCTSDADFVHLARRLRERGITVIGCGEEKAKDAFQQACSVFELLAAPPEQSTDVSAKQPCAASMKQPNAALTNQIRENAPNPKVSSDHWKMREVIHDIISEGQGVPLTKFAKSLKEKYQIDKKSLSTRMWVAYFAQHESLFALDSTGSSPMVSSKSGAFYLKQNVA